MTHALTARSTGLCFLDVYGREQAEARLRVAAAEIAANPALAATLDRMAELEAVE